jgi:hypothetical protein
MTNKQKTDWEKSYDKKFGNNLELNEGMTGIAVEEYHSNATRKVKNFISKLLLTQRQQLISEILELVKALIKGRKLWLEDGSLAPDFGVIPELKQYNQALVDIIKILEIK